ncbi:MAG: phosphoribosylaminoimidazolesuccinocarboxamide synthase, partial [Deltaproteobacteria bacterium]
ELDGRAMLAKKADMIEVECVVRGYIAGSGLKEYNANGTICGIKLSAGLVEGDKLPEPLFTPARKAHTGHDENISEKIMAEMVGQELTDKLKRISTELYLKASKRAEEGGIILADTKFEFGIINGEIILGDEIFTPDSSRFWNIDEYKPGGPQKSFDKQYMRDYLETIDWDKNPPAPELPEEVIRNTELKYLEAYQRIVGKTLN